MTTYQNKRRMQRVREVSRHIYLNILTDSVAHFTRHCALNIRIVSQIYDQTRKSVCSLQLHWCIKSH